MRKIILTLTALALLAFGSTARAGDTVTVDQGIGMGLGAGTVAAAKALAEPVAPFGLLATIYFWTDGFGGLAKKPVTKSEIEAEKAELDRAANVAQYIKPDGVAGFFLPEVETAERN